MFSNTQYFADMKVNFTGVSTQGGSLRQFGFNVVSVGDVIVNQVNASPDGTSTNHQPASRSWVSRERDRSPTARCGPATPVNFISEHPW